MKLTIEISEEEIRDEVMSLIVRRAAEQVEKRLFIDDWGNVDKKIYREAIRASVRDMMKPHIDDVIARAVGMAADQIEHKGVKQLLDGFSKGVV